MKNWTKEKQSRVSSPINANVKQKTPKVLDNKSKIKKKQINLYTTIKSTSKKGDKSKHTHTPKPSLVNKSDKVFYQSIIQKEQCVWMTKVFVSQRPIEMNIWIEKMSNARDRYSGSIANNNASDLCDQFGMAKRFNGAISMGE